MSQETWKKKQRKMEKTKRAFEISHENENEYEKSK